MHLTYHDSEAHASEALSHADKAGAPEIEITPAMIAAGASVLWNHLCVSDLSPGFCESLAEEVLLYALKVSRSGNRAAP
jgi:hypothetical protein